MFKCSVANTCKHITDCPARYINDKDRLIEMHSCFVHLEDGNKTYEIILKMVVTKDLKDGE